MMNIKTRIRKIERLQKAATPATNNDSAVSLWLETLTMDELDFLLVAHESEEFRAANAAKFIEFEARLDEYKKQTQANRKKSN